MENMGTVWRMWEMTYRLRDGEHSDGMENRDVGDDMGIQGWRTWR